MSEKTYTESSAGISHVERPTPVTKTDAELIAELRAEVAAERAARRDEESWWKEKHDYEARATKAEAALAEALDAFERITKIRWGWDGDCGAKSIAENAIDDVEDAIRAARSTPTPDAAGKKTV